MTRKRPAQPMYKTFGHPGDYYGGGRTGYGPIYQKHASQQKKPVSTMPCSFRIDPPYTATHLFVHETEEVYLNDNLITIVANLQSILLAHPDATMEVEATINYESPHLISQVRWYRQAEEWEYWLYRELEELDANQRAIAHEAQLEHARRTLRDAGELE